MVFTSWEAKTMHKGYVTLLFNFFKHKLHLGV